MAGITALSFIVPVRDLDRAVAFYRDAFQLEEVFRAEQIVFVGLPGSDSALGLLLDHEHAGSGPRNAGFHIDHAVPLDDAARDVEGARRDHRRARRARAGCAVRTHRRP